MRRRTIRMHAWVLALILSTMSGIAAAHAVLLKSSPAANQQLDAAPREIELQFNENVGPVFFKVLDRAGAEVGSPGELRVDGNSVFLPLGATLGNGTYVVTYRVISADTHPVGGSFAFAVGEPVAVSAAAAPSGGAASAWALPTLLNRIVLYASVLLALGSALALLLLQWPPASESALVRQGRIAALVAALASVTSLAIGGADIVAGGASALFSSAAWSAAFKSTLATSALLGIPGALLAAWAFSGRQSWALWVSAGLLVASFLVTGHAATASPVALAATTVALHLAGGGFWLAALRPLIIAAREAPVVDAGRLMERFSARALWLVGALLVSGAVLSWIQVRTPAALLTTDYGVRLAVKLGLVAVLLALAARNKWKLTPALTAAGADAGPAMARSIRLEALVMLLVVAAAASLTMPTPPRALLAQAAAQGASATPTPGASGDGFRATWNANNYAVDVEVTPARPGENMVMLRFRNAAGEPVTMQSASIDAALPAASLEGITVEGQAMPPDMFHFMISEIIIPGDWELRVNAFVDDFDKVVFSGTVPVK